MTSRLAGIAIASVIGMGSLFASSQGPTLAGTSFDGEWRGEYEVTKNYGDFKCAGGNIRMNIDGGEVKINTWNYRSKWIYKGDIDDSGVLKASGKIGQNKDIPVEWSGKTGGDKMSGMLVIPGVCDASWQVDRVGQ